MLKELLKNKIFCKSIQNLLKEEFVLDVFLFGSVVRGKSNPNDTDLLVLVSKKNEEVINKIYFYRKEIEKLEIKVHLLTFDYPEFISENFLAKGEFFSEAFSFRNNNFLSSLFGFQGYCLFKYSLNEMKSSKRIIFHYALKGRNGKKGILEQVNGRRLSDYTLLIPLTNADFFKEFLKNQKIKFEFWHILLPYNFK